MGSIQLLSEVVASQVAAGEVVERPASVIKELVENSIDAGASIIEVAIQGGGVALIRVTDNGKGMDREDAVLSLERHATSKLRTGEDLGAIMTLGFRGEALPSIASISRFRLQTREAGAETVGTEIQVEGGKVQSVRDAGGAVGTQIEVRSLFYNLPARKKFLRSEATEAAHIERQLTLLAMSHPEIKFVFHRDQKCVFQLPATTQLLDRIRDLFGKQITELLLPVAADPNAGQSCYQLSGFIGQAGVSRSSRQEQLVFINGRSVESQTIHQALREGYHNALMKGRYPLTFLFLDVDPALIDVNVHPAKREVRFREPTKVRAAVIECVQRTLESVRGSWTEAFAAPPVPILPIAPAPTAASAPVVAYQPTVVQEVATPSAFNFDVSMLSDVVSPSRPVEIRPIPSITSTIPTPQLLTKESQFQILGVVGKLYILLENEKGLLIIDQHAAHERVLFEELRRRLDAPSAVPSQKLLPPAILKFSAQEASWITEHLEALNALGIGIEIFGPDGTFKLESLPPECASSDPHQWMQEVVNALRESGLPAANASGSRLRLAEDVIAKTVCRHAIKANDRLKEPEIRRLITDLLGCEFPYCCPHGRPTIVPLTYSELEKKFGRRA